MPGLVAGAGLPANGAIWLRREVTIPETKLAHDPRQRLRDSGSTSGPMAGFESIYWNGQLMSQPTLDKFGGEGFPSFRSTCPSSWSKKGPIPWPSAFFLRLLPSIFPSRPPSYLSAGWHRGWPRPNMRCRLSTPPRWPRLPSSGSSVPDPPTTPGFIFNGMINPLVPYAISGVIWYQGESSTPRAYQYRHAFPLLIEDWRQHWGNPESAFLFLPDCQLWPEVNRPGRRKRLGRIARGSKHGAEASPYRPGRH